MELTVSPTYARLTGRVSQEMATALTEVLRYRDEGQYFMQRKMQRFQCGAHVEGGRCTRRRNHTGVCDPTPPEPKYVSLVNITSDGIVFPSGLVPRVLKVTGDLGVHEYGAPPLKRTAPPSPLPDGTELYEDQLQAIRIIDEQPRGLFNLATNFGKGALIAGLCHTYAAANVLIIVDGQTPLTEGRRVLEERLRVAVGQLGAGRHHIDPRARIHMATIQTLHRQRHTTAMVAYLRDTVDLLIVDEGDVVTPTQWFPVLGACQAPIRVGMSGSMRQAPHPMVVEAFFGPILMDVKDAELTASGRSARPTVLMPNVGALLPETSDYDVVYGPGIMRNAARNQIFVEAAEILARYRLRVLGIYYRLEHGELLGRQMTARGLRVRTVQGDSSPQARREAIDDLAAHRLDVVLGSNIFIRQLDAPHVEAIFNLAGWRSERATGQKEGRGRRRKDLDLANRVLILDPYDLGNNLLSRHSAARAQTYARRGSVPQRGAWASLRPVLEAFATLSRAGGPGRGVARVARAPMRMR